MVPWPAGSGRALRLQGARGIPYGRLGGDSSLLGLENHECDVAMAFGTDAIIAKYSWHVYQDDKVFWPPYDLVPYVRQEVLDKYPEVEEILNQLVATFLGGGEAATPAIVS